MSTRPSFFQKAPISSGIDYSAAFKEYEAIQKIFETGRPVSSIAGYSDEHLKIFEEALRARTTEANQALVSYRLAAPEIGKRKLDELKKCCAQLESCAKSVEILTIIRDGGTVSRQDLADFIEKTGLEGYEDYPHLEEAAGLSRS